MSEPTPPPGTPGAPPVVGPATVDVRVPPTGADPTAPTAAPAEPDENWTDQVADLVVDVVDRVRDRTTGPILQGTRVIVYGLVALLVAIPLITVGIILIGRLLELFPGEIWIAYTVLGAILLIVGLFLWGKRRPSNA